MNMKYPFEIWWETYGKRKCGILDHHLARAIALDAWNASRIEVSRYCLPVNDGEEETETSDAKSV